MSKKEEIPRPAGGGLLWLRAETYAKLFEAAKRVLVPDPVQFETTEKNGVTYFRLRDREQSAEHGGPSIGGGCPFGELVTTGESKSINGGVIFCGDRNFNVDPYDVDLTTAGKWLVEVSVSGISANTDDDHELILPGIKTASGSPAWVRNAWSPGASYSNNVNWTSPTSTATLVVPIGVLAVTIAEGETVGTVTFDPVSCGNVYAGQCAGILASERK